MVSGRPLPAGTGGADRYDARRRFGIDAEETCLLVFGGSIGARTLNEASIEAFGRAAPCAVLHACGRRDHEQLAARLAELGSPPHYHLRAYIQPFADALAAADLTVARAGGSVLEVAAAGLPAILVPYPHASADHQTRNARLMTEAGAAVMVPDDELDATRLSREVGELLSSPSALAAMSEAARRASRPDAAERIAEELLRLAA
jgi:UDP-N-acetylglucosamine--N-acetylmuramyl-(pentapeptide) pyrophosphoryl-undecaprenol N-acetylglucosamine transferase